MTFYLNIWHNKAIKLILKRKEANNVSPIILTFMYICLCMCLTENSWHDISAELVKSWTFFEKWKMAC